MTRTPLRGGEFDNELDGVLDAIRSDFADATSPAIVRDVSQAFEVLATQQECLVVINEILASLDLGRSSARKLERLSDLITGNSDLIQQGLTSIYDTHLEAQGIRRS